VVSVGVDSVDVVLGFVAFIVVSVGDVSVCVVAVDVVSVGVVSFVGVA
jgi:hypothetical protein